MTSRMFGHALFYGLGVGSAVFAMALLAPLLRSGSPTAPAGGDVMHALIGGGTGTCPYLESRGDTPPSRTEGQGSQSICPYLAGRSSGCPYLKDHARDREGSGMMPMQPSPETRQVDGWFDRTPRPRTLALIQVAHPTGHELASAGWF